MKLCLLIPTYNNAPTLEGVLRGVMKYVQDVVVVNDGCTDNTREVLARCSGIRLLDHPRNLGKGAALWSGLRFCNTLGFTHAISFDSDGQHCCEDLPKVIEAAQAFPEAIIVGVRQFPKTPQALKSRILRLNSNFWSWLQTGKWMSDTQSGFRVYPTERVVNLNLTGSKYDFEVELLVKATWAGARVIPVPVGVRYGTGARSSFRPLRDFLLVTLLNLKLFAMLLLLPRELRLRAIERSRPSQPVLSRFQTALIRPFLIRRR